MALFWTNVGVDVQTALAAAVAVTGISKASPAVVTYDGAVHPTNGDYIVMQAQGMSQLHDRPLRIANVNTSAKTFELVGEDTTASDETFVSGSYQIVTFGASFHTVQNINVSGGDYDTADLTTIHDTVKKNVPTTVNPMNLEMTNIFDLTDPGFAECNNAFKAKTTRVIRLRFGSGAKMLITGYAGASGVPTGSAGQVVQTTVRIEAQGLPTVLAS